jgi:hypothetical protein
VVQNSTMQRTHRWHADIPALSRENRGSGGLRLSNVLNPVYRAWSLVGPSCPLPYLLTFSSRLPPSIGADHEVNGSARNVSAKSVLICRLAGNSPGTADFFGSTSDSCPRGQSRKLKFVMVFLAKLESAFTVPGRGCVVVPVAPTNPDLRVKAGDVVQLRGANGCLDAHITAVEWLVRRDNGCRFGFLLSATIDCSQIVPDSEIWVGQSKHPSID